MTTARRHFLALSGAIYAAILFAGGALADPRDEPDARHKFVVDLQRAVAASDAKWIAAHIKYPARHGAGKVNGLIRSPGFFVKNYATLVGPKLRAAILAQDPANVFENWQGVMIGGGNPNIWARLSGEGDNARYLIVTINNAK